MAAKRRTGKLKITLGKGLLTLAAALRIVQLVASFFRVSVGDAGLFSSIALCCFVGGLCVFAYEHRRAAAWLSFAAAICALTDTFLLGIDRLRPLALLLYFLTFALYGLTLLSLRGRRRKWMGAAILLLGAFLTLPAAGLFHPAPGALLCLLILEWAMIGTGAYL